MADRSRQDKAGIPHSESRPSVPDALKFRWYASSDVDFLGAVVRGVLGMFGGFAIGSAFGFVVFVIVAYYLWLIGIGVLLGFFLLICVQILGIAFGVVLAIQAPQSRWLFLLATLGLAIGWLLHPIRPAPGNNFPPSWMGPIFNGETHLWTLAGVVLGGLIWIGLAVSSARNQSRLNSTSE